jgi:hypothetical protein
MGDVPLVVAALGMGMVVGSGVFQALYVMPEYFADPPASLARFQQDASVRYWLPLHAVTLIALVTGLVVEWDSGRHVLLLWGLGTYVLCWAVTFAFFIPGVVAFNRVDTTGPRSPELAQRGRRWMVLSWPRHLLMAASAILVLTALTR